MPDPAPRLTRQDIARRVARELPDGATVNLGIGIPAFCANFVPHGVELRYQAENGILGFGEHYPDGEGDPDVMDAGGKFPKRSPGMAFFDSVDSFAMIRGGHIDVTVLGALQVSRHGDLSNWMIPARGIGSIGGAMDLATNTRRVIIAMEHTAKAPAPRLPSPFQGEGQGVGRHSSSARPEPVTAARPEPATAARPELAEGPRLPSSSQGEGEGRGRLAAHPSQVKNLLANGEVAKIVEECDYPLTARRCVSMIVTDIAVIDVLTEGRGLVLRETAPGWDAKAVQAVTAARLQVPAGLKVVSF